MDMVKFSPGGANRQWYDSPTNYQSSWKFHRREKMISVELKKDGQLVGELMAAAKVFKTGSRGFFGMGKIQIDDKRYQVQVQLVEIGSKPKAEEQELGGSGEATAG
jgi:hypothetical protein